MNVFLEIDKISKLNDCNDRKFGAIIMYKDSSKSIHNNHNVVWRNFLIANMCFLVISGSD